MIPQVHVPRKRPNIIVTGTPGTGKTTFCHLLNQSLSFTYLPIGKIIIDNKLYTDWNKQFDVPEYDEDLLISFIQTNYNIAEGGLLFDFHSPGSFPKDYFDLIVLMRCSNDALYPRLQARGYKQQKIKQNIQCQIFQQIKFQIIEHFENPDILLQLINEKQEDMQTNLQRTIQWLMIYKQKRDQQQ